MSTTRPGRVDLALYADRIGFRGDLQPNASTLRALHLAHVSKIPYENVDVLLGTPISLNIGRLMDKLVVARRGGYCFEHNTLFAAVLECIGFRVSRLTARIRSYSTLMVPRTHMALLVDAEGVKWLADVGYFGCGLLEPINLSLDREMRQGFRKLVLRRDGMEWVLICQGVEQYSFTLEPHLPVDFEPLNYYCSTHPEIPWTKELRVQLSLPTERRTLVHRLLTVYSEHGPESVELADEPAFRSALNERFGLDLPMAWDAVLRTSNGGRATPCDVSPPAAENRTG
ncbi:MAG: arylamine N-acetyltransferase [Verrucomicrobiales bacterium]|nr:arylamine N-acetyltransferase [Verrucomicrobiales bacterium]